MVSGAALALPRMRDTGTPPGENGDQAQPGRSTLLRYPAWLGHFACFFAVGMLGVVFPIAGRNDLGLRESVIGALFLGRSLANAAAFFCLGRTQFWHFRPSVMLGGVALAAAGFGALAAAHSPAGLLPVFVLVGAMTGLIYSESIFHGASGSKDRAARMAIHEAVLSGGMLTGSIAGGSVFQRWGASAAYGMSAGVLLAGLAGMAVMVAVMARERSA
jgi:DHA1 family multidrug resistance protein-like MFS transporter/DHA1 family quinolone resistance protein-like MFS transporter